MEKGVVLSLLFLIETIRGNSNKLRVKEAENCDANSKQQSVHVTQSPFSRQ